MTLKSILNRVSYHVVYDELALDALRFARDNGFAGVQLAMESPHLAADLAGEREQDAVAAFSRQHGLALCLHGPDVAVSMFQTDSDLRQGMFAYLRGLFAAAERMACRMVTLHFGQMPTWPTADTPRVALQPQDVPRFRAALRDNMRTLVDLAAGRFIICMENFGLNELARAEVAPFLDAGDLALCWDLPKGRDDPGIQEFMWSHLAHVRQVHLHDVIDGKSHQVIGAGSLGFAAYLPRLAAVDVRDFCIEVRPKDKALESLHNLARLVDQLADADSASSRDTL